MTLKNSRKHVKLDSKTVLKVGLNTKLLNVEKIVQLLNHVEVIGVQFGVNLKMEVILTYQMKQ